jgi:hypothetical protein
MRIIKESTISSVVAICEYNQDLKTFNGIGSGFVVLYDEDIYLVTNKHVLSNLDNYYIMFKDSTRFNKRFIHITKSVSELFTRIYHDVPEIDICVLYLDSKLYKNINFTPIFLEKNAFTISQMQQNNIYEGEQAFILGHPYDLSKSDNYFPFLRNATISKISNQFSKQFSNKSYLVDSFAFPGNSGGPIFLSSSNINITSNNDVLIGVVTAVIIHNEATFLGLTQIIAVDHVIECINQFKNRR